MSFDSLGQLLGEVVVVKLFGCVVFVRRRLPSLYALLTIIDACWAIPPQGSYKHYLYAHDSLEL